jgi:hypothetical protein
MTRFKLGAAITSVLLLLLTNPSEGAVKSSTIMSPDATATRQEILKHVPLGTTIDQAKAFMEENGFKCAETQNQRFAEDGPAPGQQIIHGPTDTLWCDSGERSFRMALSRRWQVTFVNVGGKVSYIATAVGATGP